jgi:hypothetical protein
MKQILTILILLPAFVFGQTATQQKEMSTFPADTATTSYINSITVLAYKNGTYFNYKLYDLLKSKADATHVHSFNSLTSKPSTLNGYGITDAVPAGRTITINGVTYDLTANRSFTVSGGTGGSPILYSTTGSNTDGAMTQAATTTALGSKFNTPSGTTGQYVTGNGTLATFPTIPAQVNIIAGNGIATSGSFPNITITNTGGGSGGGASGYSSWQIDSMMQAGVGYVDVDAFKPSGGWTTDTLNTAGITANTQAIQAAIDYAAYNPAAPSHIVKIRNGLYVTNNTLQGTYGNDLDPNGGYATVIIYGSGPALDEAGALKGKGVMIKCMNTNVPGINFQGAYKSGIYGIHIKGLNTVGPPQGQETYGPWILDPKNFKLRGSTAITAPYVGISIDAYTGGAPTVAYNNAPYGYNRSTSSHVVVENCKITYFILGYGSHISGDGGQGEFMKVRNTEIYGCYEGACVSNSQNRNGEFSDGAFDVCYTGISNDDFGTERNGAVGSFNRWHFSGYRAANIGFTLLPVSFNNCYSESLAVFGHIGSNQGNSATASFVDCNWDYGQRGMRFIPLRVLEGSGVVNFIGGKMGGSNHADMDNITPNFYGTKIYNTIADEYDPIWKEDGEDPYDKWLANYPFSTGRNKIGNKDVSVFQNQKFIEGNYVFPKAGSNIYDYYEFSGATGTTGIVGDYYRTTGGNGSGQLANFTLNGTIGTFNINNFDDTRLGAQYNMIRLLAQPGDILEYKSGRLKGVKLLITKRGTIQSDGSIATNTGSRVGPGNDIEFRLMNGYTYHADDNRYYTEQRPGETFTPIGPNTIQFSQPVTLKAGVVINTLNAPAVAGFLMRVTADVNNSTTANIVAVNGGGGILYGGTFTYELHHQGISTAGSNVIRFTTPITAKKGEIPFYWGHSFTALTADITNSYTGTVETTATESLQGDLGIRYIDGEVTNYMFGLPVPQYDSAVNFFIPVSSLDKTLFTTAPEIEWHFNTWYWTSPTKATASTSSQTVTGVQHVFSGANNASAFRKGSLVYLYNYNPGVPQVQTSKQEMFVIQSIDATNGTITLDRNPTLTGDVMIYNRWPFEKINQYPSVTTLK